jgi:hypothetical protein
MVQLLIIVALGVCFVGGLVLIGQATRPIPAEPKCALCGYALQGLPEDHTNCPECGVILTPRTIQRFKHETRIPMVVLGIVIVFLPTLAIASIVLMPLIRFVMSI